MNCVVTGLGDWGTHSLIINSLTCLTTNYWQSNESTSSVQIYLSIPFLIKIPKDVGQWSALNTITASLCGDVTQCKCSQLSNKSWAAGPGHKWDERGMIYSRENGNQDVKTPIVRVTRGRGRSERRQGDRVTRWGWGAMVTLLWSNWETHRQSGGAGTPGLSGNPRGDGSWLGHSDGCRHTLVHWPQLDRKERGHTENNEETR